MKGNTAINVTEAKKFSLASHALEYKKCLFGSGAPNNRSAHKSKATHT